MKKKLVYIGFNPVWGNDVAGREMSALIRKALLSLKCRIAVPSGIKFKIVDTLLGIRRVRTVRAAKPCLCVFVTPPLASVDPFLQERIAEARTLGIKRCGFILKSDFQRGKLVPRDTFAMFSSNDTEVANAIYSHVEILDWIKLTLLGCS